MDFFTRVKLQVKRNNMTIESLMNAVLTKKHSREIYHSWKKRNCLPRGDVCLKMADLLNVSYRYLITGEETEKDILQSKFLQYKNFLENLDDLTDKDLEDIETLIFAFTQKKNVEIK